MCGLYHYIYYGEVYTEKNAYLYAYQSHNFKLSDSYY